MVICETRSVSGNDLSGEGHEWGAKPTKLKGEVVKQVIDMIEELKMKLKHKEEILDEVYNYLQYVRDLMPQSFEKDELKKAIEMMEDL
ncbi:MAG: hypothetical protein V4708_17065 [Bacteroidota bacterium]